MNILNWIFQNKTIPENKSNTYLSSGNCIVFSLNPESNNDPYIKIIIDDTSVMSSVKFAELLYDIFTGMYNESTINLMMKMSNENPELKQFIHSCILNWSLLARHNDHANKPFENKNYEENIPVVMPTDFNKNAK